MLELPDRPDHTQQNQQEQKQQHSLQQQNGARAKHAPPFIVSVPAVASVVAVCVYVSAVCDQDDRIIATHPANDIHEAH